MISYPYTKNKEILIINIIYHRTTFILNITWDFSIYGTLVPNTSYGTLVLMVPWVYVVCWYI